MCNHFQLRTSTTASTPTPTASKSSTNLITEHHHTQCILGHKQLERGTCANFGKLHHHRFVPSLSAKEISVKLILAGNPVLLTSFSQEPPIAGQKTAFFFSSAIFFMRQSHPRRLLTEGPRWPHYSPGPAAVWQTARRSTSRSPLSSIPPPA